MSKKSIPFILVGFVLLFLSCPEPTSTTTDDSDTDNTVTDSDIITYVTISSSSETIDISGTLTLSSDSDGDSADLSWESSDASIATVSGSGAVTPVSPGHCTISVTHSDGLSDTCSLTISPVEGSYYEFPELALFSYPWDMVEDSQGNIYVSDYVNNKIRRISAGGIVSTIGTGSEGYVDGSSAEAQFDNPCGLGVDSDDNIFVADKQNDRIRMISPSGVVSTYAGTGENSVTDGDLTTASFSSLEDIAVAADGTIYVVDGRQIRTISPDGAVSSLTSETLNGDTDGDLDSARFNYITSIALGDDGTLYICDCYNNSIRKLSGDTVSTLAGGSSGSTDGTGTDAQFSAPTGIGTRANGNLLVADRNNHRVREITPAGVVTTLTGSTQDYADGTLDEALFDNPAGILERENGTILVSDWGNDMIRAIDDTDVSIYAGASSGIGSPDGIIPELYFSSPRALTCGSGGDVFITEAQYSNGTDNNIYRYDEDWNVSLFTEIGAIYGADIVYDDTADTLYLCDSEYNKLYKVDNVGDVSLLAGSDEGDTNGTGSEAQFHEPTHIALASDSTLYVLDRMNDKIRAVSDSGVVNDYLSADFTLDVGTTILANSFLGKGLSVDPDDNLYVGNTSRDNIYKISPAAEPVVSMIMNSETGEAADIDSIYEIYCHTYGNLYIADSSDLKKISPNGTVDTIFEADAGVTDLTYDGKGNLLILTSNGIQTLQIEP